MPIRPFIGKKSGSLFFSIVLPSFNLSNPAGQYRRESAQRLREI